MSDARSAPIVTISIDTEEDDWGRYIRTGHSVRNIDRLQQVQDVFDRWGARPTYLVNLPPLSDGESVRVLGDLATRSEVEIGAQCHSWNTPPYSDEHEGNVENDESQSMMSSLSIDLNRSKIRTMRDRLRSELGVEPTSFRAGRWGFGPTVSEALAEEGFWVDASVTPFIDWSRIGGPDFSPVPCTPYRFDPRRPFRPDPDGSMVELPTTIGFLAGDPAASARRRAALEKNLVGRARLVGLLDRLGFLAKRWLSPETSTARELLLLTRAWVESGKHVLAFTFHSSTLLPGATPFVSDRSDLDRFLARIDRFLEYCVDQGFEFATLTELGTRILDGDHVEEPGRVG